MKFGALDEKILARVEPRPEIDSKYQRVYRIYLLLNARRGSGLGLSPISFADIVSALDFFKVRRSRRRIYLEAICLIDSLMLDFYSKLPKDK